MAHFGENYPLKTLVLHAQVEFHSSDDVGGLTHHAKSAHRVAFDALMASSSAFVYLGEYYALSLPNQLVNVKGPWGAKGKKLFQRYIVKDADGTERDETGQEMLERIKSDAAAYKVRPRLRSSHFASQYVR